MSAKALRAPAKLWCVIISLNDVLLVFMTAKLNTSFTIFYYDAARVHVSACVNTDTTGYNAATAKPTQLNQAIHK
jgi:hypothetical protein